jgi:hypothetical protein
MTTRHATYRTIETIGNTLIDISRIETFVALIEWHEILELMFAVDFMLRVDCLPMDYSLLSLFDFQCVYVEESLETNRKYSR